jgi:AAA15 family ATPase/GTPase
MVKQLKIQNYKSIRDLDLPCKKINVFIGEPNSGKSNIIEALGFLSQNIVNNENLKKIIRFKDMGGLFYDYNFTKPITINTGIIDATIKYDVRENGTIGNQFLLNYSNTEDNANKYPVSISHDGRIDATVNFDTPFSLYEYKRLENFQQHYLSHLLPPYGINLPTILLGNPDLKKWVNDFFRSKGFKVTLKPVQSEIEISKEVDGSEYSYPYFVVSETLQRIVFYNVAMESNNNKVLLFDEPDSNTFPFYTKYLGERIALDETNQFFITTHNPYLLLNLIEKSPADNINVCVAQMKGYETVITVLDTQQIAQVLDLNSDLFFNLDIITSA